MSNVDEETGTVDEMSIGEFAKRCRLSPKALRLYDELGLLAPARVDDSSGYRFYDSGQLERARLVAGLRQLRMPLAEIKQILSLDEPAAAAVAVAEYWAGVETEHSARRELAGYLIDRISGKRSVMYEVSVREMPSRSVLCLKRNVTGGAQAWALGKEFVGLLRGRPAPRMEGRAGAAFCIYWSQVSEDSDGPLEWCRPVPDDEAQALAGEYPELTLRTEPAHIEAFVHLGAGNEIGPAQWQLASESLHAWGEEHRARPSDLGVRVTYLASMPLDERRGPDCDFAVPLENE
ncbi:MAG TPA: helix-turn-helix domain-containing protein [Solirubrobacteraceae bacterium]|nr:helix-turn-helix domain-containing protein [Solirubrobacteraceae bacterium]